jgi:hypothetical protein
MENLIKSIYKIIKNKHTIYYIITQVLSYFRHICRVNRRMIKQIDKWKPISTRPKFRPTIRFEVVIVNNLTANNWRGCVQNRKIRKEGENVVF